MVQRNSVLCSIIEQLIASDSFYIHFTIIEKPFCLDMENSMLIRRRIDKVVTMIFIYRLYYVNGVCI